jgi:hypothetical protein
MGMEPELRKIFKAGRKRVCDSKLSSIVDDFLASASRRSLPLRGGVWSQDKNWRQNREKFCQLAWPMMPPFFKKFDPASARELYQMIPNQASLPWISIDKEAPIQGEFSYVRKFRIHPDQHNLASLLLIIPRGILRQRLTNMPITIGIKRRGFCSEDFHTRIQQFSGSRGRGKL